LTRYFVYTSGENNSIGKAEVNALTNLLNLKRPLWRNRLGLIDCETNPVPFLLDRAALVKEAGLMLAESSETDTLLSDISDDDLKRYVPSSCSFSVRTIPLGKKDAFKERQDIEVMVGGHIKHVTGAPVSLDNPQVRILVFLSDEGTMICTSTASKLRLDLRNREPGLKPFFHPSMMNAFLARVMCNLAGVMPGEIVLDPFCGGGGILCEASLIGAKTVGVDLNWKLLVGSMTNLTAIGMDYSLVQGDVRKIPIRMCDCVVTDPPYGRASSTRGAHAVRLVENLLENIDSLLTRRTECVCICGDSEMNIPKIAERYGLTVGQALHIRVHSGLVREVLTIGY
jgi:tRNA (guanine10-N2)-dimethyltransferase